MSTAYHFDRDKRSNLNIYVKPVGAAASPWSTGVVAFTAVSGGQAGLYSGDVDDDTAYVVYIRAGASPAATDEVTAFLEQANGFIVVPLTGVVEERATGTSLVWFTDESITQSISVIDSQGSPVTVTGLSLKLCFETWDKVDVALVGNSDITKSGSTISFTTPAAVTANEGQYRWSLRRTADDGLLMQGTLYVQYAASVDA